MKEQVHGRIFGRVAAVVFAFSLFAGCSEPKELRVGTDGDYPPWVYVDPDTGQHTGFDVELANAACAKLGYRPTFHTVVWEKKLEILNAGTVDCLWCGFTSTGREKDYSILGPYFENYLTVISRREAGIRTFKDIADKVIGYQSGTTSEMVFEPGGEAEKLGVKPKSVVKSPYIETCVSQLKNGVVDAMVIDIDYARELIKATPELFAIIPGVRLHPEEIGVGFRIADAELRDRFAGAIDELVADGIVKRLAVKYFNDPSRWIWKSEK